MSPFTLIFAFIPVTEHHISIAYFEVILDSKRISNSNLREGKMISKRKALRFFLVNLLFLRTKRQYHDSRIGWLRKLFLSRNQLTVVVLEQSHPNRHPRFQQFQNHRHPYSLAIRSRLNEPNSVY